MPPDRAWRVPPVAASRPGSATIRDGRGNPRACHTRPTETARGGPPSAPSRRDPEYSERGASAHLVCPGHDAATSIGPTAPKICSSAYTVLGGPGRYPGPCPQRTRHGSPDASPRSRTPGNRWPRIDARAGAAPAIGGASAHRLVAPARATGRRGKTLVSARIRGGSPPIGARRRRHNQRGGYHRRGTRDHAASACRARRLHTAVRGRAGLPLGPGRRSDGRRYGDRRLSAGHPGGDRVDRAPAIQSPRKQAGLDIDVACFGHGAPLVGGADRRLRALAETL